MRRRKHRPQQRQRHFRITPVAVGSILTANYISSSAASIGKGLHVGIQRHYVRFPATMEPSYEGLWTCFNSASDDRTQVLHNEGRRASVPMADGAKLC